MTKSVVIASAVRTAIGAFGGSLAGIAPSELGASVAGEAIRRAGIEGKEVQQTVFGNVIHTQPEDMYLSRVIAIKAGVPETAPALTLNRLCGSGLQAVVSAFGTDLIGQCRHHPCRWCGKYEPGRASANNGAQWSKNGGYKGR